MKVNIITAACFALASVASQAADQAGASSAPKNLARQHLGANLLIFNAANQTYTPTEAAAAWLDDDIATGWPALTGKQDYLLALPEPALVNNFFISAKSATGTVTLYAGDEAAAPGAKSWTLLAKDVPIESINEHAGKAFGRFAKYILIESNLTESGPWYSVYVWGEKPATAFHIQQRAQPVDPRTTFGPYTNPQTSFSLTSLYAHSQVTLAAGDSSAWANMIDDNPATGTIIQASTDGQPGLAIRFDKSYSIQRISALTEPGTKGKLEIFLTSPETQPASTTARDNRSQYIRVSNNLAAMSGDSAAPAGSSDTPVATLNFDGSSPRASVDFPAASGSTLTARWTPETAGQPLNLRELNSFGDIALNDYELAPDAVSEGPATGETSGKDGKDTADAKDGKATLPPVGEALPPVGESLPAKTAFIPGVPLFPPNIPFSP